MEVYYLLYLTLAYIFDHDVRPVLRVCRKFGPKLASHYKPVENEVKFGLSEPYSANSVKVQLRNES